MAGAGDGEGQSLCLGTAVAFWSGKTAVFWPLSGTSIIKKKNQDSLFSNDYVCLLIASIGNSIKMGKYCPSIQVCRLKHL